VLAQLVRVAVVADPTEQVTDITDDPADTRVLEAAAEGEATVVISGDRHLLTLGTWRGIRSRRPQLPWKRDRQADRATFGARMTSTARPAHQTLWLVGYR
jgi:hypothetical protein